MVHFDRCSFSWRKVYPGHGIRFVHLNSHLFIFGSSKARCCHNIKRSSRTTLWTFDWRKAHKKDGGKALKKRVKHKALRYQKDIVGMTLEEINNKVKTAKHVDKPAADAARLKEVKKRQKKAPVNKKTKAPPTKAPVIAKVQKKGR